MDAQEYNAEFKKACKIEFDSYRDELTFVLDHDAEEIAEHFDLGNPEEASFTDYVNVSLLAVDEPVSGYYLNSKKDTDQFYDDVSYVVVTKATGGPNVDYIIGSNGEAFVDYSYGENKFLRRVGGDYEDSLMHDHVNELFGKAFSANEFEIGEEEKESRLKHSLGVDSVGEWMIQYANKSDGESVSFETFVDFLEERDFDTMKAATSILKNGGYNAENDYGDKLGREDFVADIEKHISTIESLMQRSDWEDVVDLFHVNENSLTYFDADDLSDSLDAEFEAPEEDKPEVKKTRTRKPGM